MQDLILIGYAWLTTSIWQWLAVPFLIPWLRTRSLTGGWAWGRLASWLTLSLFIWFVAHSGLPVNTTPIIWLTLIVFAWFSHRQWQAHRAVISEFVRSHQKMIFWQEALFLIGFVALAWIRTYHPAILDLEKFMDAGLMEAYRHSPALPLQDMWLAGKTFNYYTFGHFMGNIISQFWNLDVTLSYNLLLGLVCGLVLMESFAVVVDWVYGSAAPRSAESAKIAIDTSIKAGLIASILVGIGGNGHIIWFWLKNHTFTGYWYPDATRFIDRTIHEFPSYSFIVSDLHAHVWGIPIVLALTWLIWLWAKAFLTEKPGENWWQWLTDPAGKLAAAIGVGLGVLMVTSTWDFAIYGLVLGLVGLGVWLNDFKLRQFLRLSLTAIFLLIIAAVTASPWWLHFESISQGVKMAYEHSPLWQLAVLWLPHLAVSLIAVGVALFQWAKTAKPQKLDRHWVDQRVAQLMIVALVVAAMALIVIPEVIFVKDIYPNHPRANTMFKLTFQAFILMGLVIGWLSGRVFAPRPKQTGGGVIWQWLAGGFLLLFVAAVSIYPFFGYRDYYGGFKDRTSLDGLQWLAKESPGDYAAVQWLKQTTTGRPVVLEGVGESYTTFARVSTFTGLPTVLGWRVHEWLWRGGFDIPGERTEHVRVMYEEPTTDAAQTLFAQYQVKYIMIGDREREAYPNLDLINLRQLGRVVFRNGQTEIVALP